MNIKIKFKSKMQRLAPITLTGADHMPNCFEIADHQPNVHSPFDRESTHSSSLVNLSHQNRYSLASNYQVSESHNLQLPALNSEKKRMFTELISRQQLQPSQPKPHLSLMRSNFRKNKMELLQNLFRENEQIHVRRSIWRKTDPSDT